MFTAEAMHAQGPLQPDDRALGERSGPEEDRNADGALMPGAPGTNNPTIPDDA